MTITPRHLRTREERDAMKRANGHRPVNEYGEGWQAACETIGVHPLSELATADVILGKMPEGIWDADGERVYMPGNISEHATMAQPVSRIAEVDFRDMAQLNGVSLTEAEWAVVDAIADIGTGYGYAKAVGERLGISANYVRVHLNRVREKILSA